MNLEKLFSLYTNNVAIIYAHLEGQYKYQLLEDEEYVLLLTMFDYHFVAGKVPKDEKRFIAHCIDYIKKHEKEEFVLFAPTKEWEDFLQKAIKHINGIVDARILYQINKESFAVLDVQREYCILEEIKSPKATSPLLRASMQIDGHVVAHATALMTGKKHVEIDVFTEEDHRKKGLAFKVSHCLIKELLYRDLTPDWCCWRVKEASKQLALKLGFFKQQEFPAYVWVNDLKARDLL